MAKDLKTSIEAEIQKMLKAKESPDEGRMKLLALGIKMCALNAKLEESEYGGFFDPSADAELGHPDGAPKRKRAEPVGDLGAPGAVEH